MDTKFLTPKQKQVLDFIQSFQRQNGYAPSQKEIAESFGFSSLGTVQHYLKQLEELGYLQKALNARRGLSVSTVGELADLKGPPENLGHIRSLLLVGQVAAGRPIEATQNSEWLEVPASLLKKSGEHFVLRVQGDSMIEDGILNGDYVVIRKQTTAENGDTVVALIENEATIKRYQRKKGSVELHAANPAYPTIHVDPNRKFKIEGILAGLIRKVP